MFLLRLPEGVCLDGVWKDDAPSLGTLLCLYCRHHACCRGLLWTWGTVKRGDSFPCNHFTDHAEKCRSCASGKSWVFISED